MVLPVAAVPMRVCFLDQKDQQEDCCKNCLSEHKDCCAEKDKLPDSPAPGGSLEIPPFIAFEIPLYDFGFSPEIVTPFPPRFAQPIRGPDSPAACRSILSVWRL